MISLPKKLANKGSYNCLQFLRFLKLLVEQLICKWVPTIETLKFRQSVYFSNVWKDGMCLLNKHLKASENLRLEIANLQILKMIYNLGHSYRKHAHIIYPQNKIIILKYIKHNNIYYFITAKKKQ